MMKTTLRNMWTAPNAKKREILGDPDGKKVTTRIKRSKHANKNLVMLPKLKADPIVKIRAKNIITEHFILIVMTDKTSNF